jgi:hypothetical protein
MEEDGQELLKLSSSSSALLADTAESQKETAINVLNTGSTDGKHYHLDAAGADRESDTARGL